jgi:hypothetical protein
MTDIADENVKITKEKRQRIRERVLQAEKDKLHLDNPRGIINDVEEIIREEIN